MAVAEFLLFTDRAPTDSLGAIPPAMREVKVRHVAALGVMSGCSAEFMPILLAFTEAMKVGDFRRTLCSTHAWTPYCWLNGPFVRHEARLARTEGAQTTPTPPWLKWTGLSEIETVPVMKAGKSAFLVTGDPARNKELCLPGGGSATLRPNQPSERPRLRQGMPYMRGSR